MSLHKLALATTKRERARLPDRETINYCIPFMIEGLSTGIATQFTSARGQEVGLVPVLVTSRSTAALSLQMAQTCPTPRGGSETRGRGLRRLSIGSLTVTNHRFL